MIEINSILQVMNHINDLKAVIFDLDDTLYSEKEYVKSGYNAVSKQIPQVTDAETKLYNAFEENKVAIDEVLYSEGIYTEELKQMCLKTYRAHRPNIHLYDGVCEMLKCIRENGYFIGLITDGRPEGQRAKIKSLGLEEYVDYIIVTDELGGVEFRKPNEKAYIMMKERFKLEFCEMSYVGDNICKDFVSPNKLGMRSIWFRNPDGLYSH